MPPPPNMNTTPTGSDRVSAASRLSRPMSVIPLQWYGIPNYQQHGYACKWSWYSFATNAH